MMLFNKIIKNKNIAISDKVIDIKSLMLLIHSRDDELVSTGVTFKIERTVWQGEPDGYGGEFVRDGDDYYQQKQIVANEGYNQRRLRALEALRKIGGINVILALLKPIQTDRYEMRVETALVVSDDLSFELIIEGRRKEIVCELLAEAGSSMFESVLEHMSTEEAHRLCTILYSDYKEQFHRIIGEMAIGEPNELIKLVNLLLRGKIQSSVYIDDILSVIDESVLNNTEIIQLIRFCITVPDINLRKVSKRVIIRNMTFEKAVDVVNNIRIYDIQLNRFSMSIIIYTLFILGKGYPGIKSSGLSIKSFLEYIGVFRIEFIRGGRKEEKFTILFINMGCLKIFNEFLDSIESIFPTIEQNLSEHKTSPNRVHILHALLFCISFIRNKRTKHLLFKLAEKIIGNKKTLGSDITDIIKEILSHQIDMEDIPTLKAIYQKVLSSQNDRWGSDNETANKKKDAVLIQLAVLLYKYDKSIVNLTWGQWIRGRQPFLSKRIRKKLLRMKVTF